MKMRQTFSDEDIIELYWQRNEDAIRVTNDKYGKFLYRIAYQFLHDHSDCEECQNDTYHRVWKMIPPTRPRAFRAFLAGILRNIAIDKYHEKTNHKKIPSEFCISLEECEGFLSHGESPDETLMAEELGKMISRFLRTRSEKDRYIFMSRFYLVEPIETIAKELHLTESAVYKKLAKLKRDLQDELAERGVL